MPSSNAVVHLADRTGILVTGKDRTSWLNGLVTQDLAKLGRGEAGYAFLVEKKGRIQADLFVLPSRNAEDAWLLAVPTDLRDGLLETLDHYLIMEDAEITTVDVPFWLALGDAELTASYGGKVRGIGTVLAGDGADAAAKASGAIVDDEAWNALRIERGLPRWGVEVDTTLYPQEASLEDLAVSFDKGCYLGQEVVYMLQNRGHVKRKLVTLDLDGTVSPKDVVTTEAGDAVGEVKSAAIAPSNGKAVAIAMVKFAQSTPGTALRVGERHGTVRASERATASERA